ncbi:hypothetical protein N9360_00770 [Candidatus Marinimicrobia bacterium]|nr:hypothetical protein [Candidatus Neomarinimicrobiota bacterium]
MNYLRRNMFLQLITAFVLMFSLVDARDKNKNSASSRYFGISGLPTDYEEFNVNNWTIDTSNDGRTMVNSVRGVGGEWQNTGVFLVYASSWWFGGQVDGQLKIVGNEFSSDMEVGPYGGDPNSQAVRTYNVSKAMLADPIAYADFQEWPVDMGAPWVDVDGDGVYSPLPNGTDHPEFVGDQVIWSIQNDGVASRKGITGGSPTNVEVRTTMFGFDRPDAFGDIVFFKHAVTNTQDKDITDAYFGVWVDPDNGDYSADLIGVDPELSLGYCYNDGVDDEWAATEYGPGPAVGYDFFQGPAVPCEEGEDCPGATQFGETVAGYKNLGLSGYNLYINSDAVFGDPEEPDEFYFGLQGLRSDGTQLAESITGATCTPETVADGTCTNPYVNCEGVAAGGTCYSNFSFWGDPAVDPDLDADGTVTDAELALNPIDGYVRESSDRRFLQSVGPFTLKAGDTQEIVYGALAAYSTDTSVASIAVLKQVDQLAQLAYDINFALPDSPPSPQVGMLVDKSSVKLYWDDAAVSYEAESLVDLDANGNATKFKFEGFKVYQYSNPTGANAKNVATFDVNNGITEIIDTVFDANYGVNIDIPVASGSDNGASTEFNVTQDYINNSSLLANREYYFGVSSYGYNADGIPKMLESSPTVVAFRPAENLSVDMETSLGTAIVESKVGLGDGYLDITVVDPTAITGDDYKVTFDASLPDGTEVVNWTLTNVTTGVELIKNNTIQAGIEMVTKDNVGVDAIGVTEGFRVVVNGPPPGHNNFREIAAADIDNYMTAPMRDPNITYAPLGNTYTAGGSLSATKGILENRIGYTGNATSGLNLPAADGAYFAAHNWDYDVFDYQGTDDVVFDFSTPSVAHEWPYAGTNRYGSSLVPFSAHRFTVDGRKEQLWVTFEDLDGSNTWSLVDYDEVDKPYSAYPGFRTGMTNEERDALEAAYSGSMPGTWYADQAVHGQVGPSYGTIGYEPIYIMGYQTTPYDPSLESVYLSNDDISVNGGCEHYHGIWYGGGCDMDTSNLNAPSTAYGNTHWGTYFSGLIYTTYFAADATSPGTSPLPTAAGSAQYGFTGAGAWVVINNKPNSPFVEFQFSTADNMTEAKDYVNDNVTVWPNPYYGANVEETGPYDQKVMFSNLPSEGKTTVRIYAIDGTLVRLLSHNDQGSQHMSWDLNNEYGLPVASGMYFAHVEAKNTEKILKLAIVQPEMRIDTY